MTSTLNPTLRRRIIRPPRPLAILAAAAIVVGATYVFGPALRPSPRSADRAIATAEPIARADGSAPISAPIDAGAPPAGSLRQIDHSIEAWSKNLAANPKDYLAATNLALLYQGRGRLSYDLSDHERALTAAETALKIEPGNAPARAIRAVILFTLHEFTGAYAAADEVVRDDPTQLGAIATRFDAEIELGRIDDARADLERLAVAGGPATLIREARLASVTGHPKDALANAQRARSAAIADDEGDVGFYAYAVGEYARLASDATAARAAYRAALDARSSDIAALVGLARVDAYEGHIEAALAGLQRAVAIAPQPEALALLGDLQTATGDTTAGKSFETVRFIEKLGDIQARTYDRQLLRFELDHGGASEAILERARASLEARPDWTGHDTLAWALYRLGRYDAAADQIAAARALGSDDARLRYHEGAIAIALGERSQGDVSLTSALELGPALDPIERAEAIRLLGR